jgi:SAM-dependent methyltransferase
MVITHPVIYCALSMEQPYSKYFYENLTGGSIRSARVMVPLVLDLVQPKSVADVGCGIGTWLKICREHGVEEILGVDGGHVDREQLLIPEECTFSADLSEPLHLEKTYDLVISLEVGEHLPAESAQTLVDTVTRLGPVVMFSAAIPFQGGTSHMNEQWQQYWARMFQDRGYLVIDCLRPKVWADPAVLPCYAQNTLLYVRSDRIHLYQRLQLELERDLGGRLSAVHPALYQDLVDPSRCSFREALSFFYAVAKNRLYARLGHTSMIGGPSPSNGRRQ